MYILYYYNIILSCRTRLYIVTVLFVFLEGYFSATKPYVYTRHTWHIYIYNKTDKGLVIAAGAFYRHAIVVILCKGTKCVSVPTSYTVDSYNRLTDECSAAALRRHQPPTTSTWPLQQLHCTRMQWPNVRFRYDSSRILLLLYIIYILSL